MHEKQIDPLRLPLDREIYDRIAEYAKEKRIYPGEALSELLDLGLRIASIRSQYAGIAMEGDEPEARYGNETLSGFEPQSDPSADDPKPEKGQTCTKSHSLDPPTWRES